MKVKSLIAFLIVLAACDVCFSQAKWESVPVDKWETKHVENILNDSAWVKTEKVQHSTGNASDGKMTARVRLRSALPIRLALLRKQQLEKGYDKMSEQEKGEFDKKNSALLGCPACRDYYVITIISKDSLLDKDFVDKNKKLIYLENDRGERRELVNFLPQSGLDQSEQIFFFQRKDEKGELLLAPENKSFTLNLNFKVEDPKGFPVKKVKFSVPEITRDGIVLF